MDPQGHDAVTDAALDGEIRRALAVDPSPEFLARVRTRIADEPVPRSGGLMWVVIAPAVFALVLIAIVAIWRRASTDAPRTRPTVLTARSIDTTTPVSLRPVAQAFRPASAIAGLKPRATRTEFVRTRSGVAQAFGPAKVQEPEALVAADEMRAIRELIVGVQEGRITLSPAVAERPVDDIVIEPITIAPIPPMTGEQGVRQ